MTNELKGYLEAYLTEECEGELGKTETLIKYM